MDHGLPCGPARALVRQASPRSPGERVQDERPFVACRKVMMDMGAPYNQHELVSFHTISKVCLISGSGKGGNLVLLCCTALTVTVLPQGALGECGLRGGMMEATNIHPGTIEQIYKIASVNLSPNTTGQVLALVCRTSWGTSAGLVGSPTCPPLPTCCMGAQAGAALMVNPPKPGDPSYEQHKAEEESIIASLRRRAQMVTDGFNACEGVTCNFTEGAMYSFPKLQLPSKVSTCTPDTASLPVPLLPSLAGPCLPSTEHQPDYGAISEIAQQCNRPSRQPSRQARRPTPGTAFSCWTRLASSPCQVWPTSHPLFLCGLPHIASA